MQTFVSYLLRGDLPGGRACAPARDWVASLPECATLEDVYHLCPRGEWLPWLLRRLGLPAARRVAAARPAVLRALREYAPAALEATGIPDLIEHAARLRALPDDVDMHEAAAAAEAAEAAAEAAAWAAAEAAKAAEAAWAAAAAAAAAAAEAGAAAELARCADDVRATFPWREVGPLLAAAIGDAPTGREE